MEVHEKLQICKICTNKEFNRQIGLVCRITHEKPEFNDICDSFIKDDKEAERVLQLKLNGAGNIETAKGKSPIWLKRVGILSLALGIGVTLFSFLGFFGLYVIVAYGAIINGILMIRKAKKQELILKETEKLNDKLKKKNIA
jgi:hypothetical protein